MRRELKIEVRCDQCTNELEAIIAGEILYIKPCDFCLEGEYTMGWDDGHREADGEEEEEP